MKKLIVFIFICVLFVLSSFVNMNPVPDFYKFPLLKIELFSSEKISNLTDVEIISNGMGSIIVTDRINAERLEKELTSISGKTYIFQGGKQEFSEMVKLFNIKPVLSQSNNVLGFTDKMPYSVFVENKKVSIQVFLNESAERIYVGSPLLLGSY